MAETARNLEAIPLPESKESEEVFDVESGEFELIDERIESEAAGAENEVRGVSAMAEQDLAEDPDLATKLSESQEEAVQTIATARRETKGEADTLRGIERTEEAEAPIELAEIEPPPESGERERITTESPEGHEELAVLRKRIEETQAKVVAVESKPEEQRTDADRAQIEMLGREMAVLRNTLERATLEADAKSKELRLTKLDEEMAELLKKTPANDVDALGPEEKERAKEIADERGVLEYLIAESREHAAELAAAAVGLEQLALQSKAGHRRLEEEAAAEAAREDARMKAEFQARQEEELQKSAEEAEAKRKKEGAEKWNEAGRKFKRGVGGGAAAAGLAGVASLFSIEKAMGWIDRTLGNMFKTSIVDKLGSLWRKLTFADYFEQKNKKKQE
ncbi:hypothetical protein HY479_02700 [Candidatus Uhrbacteria bacterium]|nr:hypothetical protein [Candidatus Uhrbacteria bacterium]